MTLLTKHQRDALDFKNHISLTANAGSGKTFVLSRRYLEIAVSENVSLRNIAAITFTDKAASELYKKIAGHVEDRIRQSDNSVEINKLENIRRQLVSANISTIHSFCIDILREFPVEAGLDANFSPIDERISNELIELSVEEVVKSSLSSDVEADELKYLIRIFASKRLFAGELISLIKNRKNVLSLSSNLYKKTFEEIADFFSNKFESLLGQLFFSNINQLINNLREVNDSVLQEQFDNLRALTIRSRINKLAEASKPVEIFKLLLDIKASICSGKKTIYIKDYLKRESRIPVDYACRFIEDYFIHLPSFEMDNRREVELELAHFGKKIIYFFNKAVEIYSAKKKENGCLDYEDILLFTQKVLENKNVREELYKKYKYIMIDEYQDTNELQYQIFLPILDHLKKGNLFVVGDEKQSIYMFRDAELEIFNLTKNNIRQESGADKLLNLPDSFRMAPELCLFTNYIFKNLFSNPNPLFNEVEHSDLVSARENADEGKVEILIAGKEGNADKLAEAELVSKKILNIIMQNENIKWSDVAILCRKRKSFTELERAFIKYQIPFMIVGGKGFYQKQMIYDIYNYFSFLLDSENDTALVGILRSPFFSISDAEIFQVSRHPEKTYWKKLQACASDDDRFVNVVKCLESHLAAAGSADISSLLRRILIESDYLAVLASKSNGRQELANINKLVTLTINFNAQGFNTLYDYVDFLKDAINETEDESQAGIADESNSVKIMTLHQAKGLEYPVVILFKCNETSKNSLAKSKKVQVDKTFGLLTKIPLEQNYFEEYKCAPVVELSNFISNKKNLAEIKRLFYVGVTRAKDYLILSAEYEKNFNYSSASFMGLFQEALKDQFNEQEIFIESQLQYLKKDAEGYKNTTSVLHLRIPVIYDLPDVVLPLQEVELEYQPKDLLINKINDLPEGEIISATKVSVYKQCPLKYKLTYELGYSTLFNSYKSWLRDNPASEFNFNDEEDLISNEGENEPQGIRNLSVVKGRIIHSILQKEIPLNHLNDFISQSIKNELNIFEFTEEKSNQLKQDVYNDIYKFYNSNIFSFLMKFGNYKNEFEIYVKENDYFLYGIIDKLITENEKVIIVDYKTDDIMKEQIPGRAEAYLTQLRFYSYIVSRFLRNINNFELRIIFIKHPDSFVTEKVSLTDIEVMKKEILEMIINIRGSKFSKSISHCSKCSYALNFANCIVRG